VVVNEVIFPNGKIFPEVQINGLSLSEYAERQHYRGDTMTEWGEDIDNTETENRSGGKPEGEDLPTAYTISLWAFKLALSLLWNFGFFLAINLCVFIIGEKWNEFCDCGGNTLLIFVVWLLGIVCIATFPMRKDSRLA